MSEHLTHLNLPLSGQLPSRFASRRSAISTYCGSGASVTRWNAQAYPRRTRRALSQPAIIEGHVERGEAFLLEVDGISVSVCTHDARVRDNVQIGGVWTPPELRGRGYARRVVAGSLQAAEREGVKRAVLFTENPAARHSYEALGVRRVGDFGVIVLAT